MEDRIKSRNTFGKRDKLCGKKVIDQLFARGRSFISYPLRVVYLVDSSESNSEYTAKVLISVSKRNFKRANKRNRIKRLVREVYRLNKMSLVRDVEVKKVCVDIAFIHLNKELPEYLEIDKAMKKALTLLQEKIEKSDNEKGAN